MRALAAMSRRPRFDDVAVENFLAIAYGDATCFLALVAALRQDANWGDDAVAQGPHLPAVVVHDRTRFEEASASLKVDGSGTWTCATASANLQLLTRAGEQSPKSG